MSLYCAECGAMLQPGKKFCSNCGTKVDTAEAGDAQALPSSPQEPPASLQEPPQSPQAPPFSPQQAPPFSPQQSPLQSPQAPPLGPQRPVSGPQPFPPQRPMAASGQTMALYDQDQPPSRPISKPDQRADFAPKKQAVYPQQNMNAQYPPRPTPYAAPGAPVMPMPSGEAPMGMVNYMVNLLIMSIPIAGLVLSVIWGVVNPTPPARSNLAKAMIAFNVIWGIIIIFFICQFYSILSQVADISVKFGF